MPSPKKHKLDIFQTLNALDARDKEYLDRQPDEARKGFVPMVVMRWMSAVEGPKAEEHILAVNEFLNVDFHALYDYPDLQYRCLSLAGQGKRQRHQWIPVAKSSRDKSPVMGFLSQFYPLASDEEIRLVIDLHTPETFEELVDQSGTPPKQAKELINGFLAEKSHQGRI